MPDEKDDSDTVDDLAASNVPIGVVHVDIGGRTHRGKIRPNNEDNFHIVRFGRYLQSVASSLPDSGMLEELENIGYGYCVADGLGGHA